MKKLYTKGQRRRYGTGWFLISFFVGLICVYFEYRLLGYLAFAFSIMSIVAIGPSWRR